MKDRRGAPVTPPPADLAELLRAFWVSMMTDTPDPSDRIRASELLAKYFLGSAPPTRGPARRPSTAEVLSALSSLSDGDAGAQH